MKSHSYCCVSAGRLLAPACVALPQINLANCQTESNPLTGMLDYSFVRLYLLQSKASFASGPREHGSAPNHYYSHQASSWASSPHLYRSWTGERRKDDQSHNEAAV